jgi:hypothetical protein
MVRQTRPAGGRGWIALGLLALATSYFLLLPWFRPHGIYFGYRYRLPDLYLGTPLLLATICALIVQCTPASRRRPRAIRLIIAYVLLAGTVYGIDVAYAAIGTTMLGLPHYDIWLYSSGISSRDSLRDDQLGFLRKPGLNWTGETAPGFPVTTYRTDENGFRNPPGIRQTDVAITGDSFVEAGAVPEEKTAVQRIAQETGLRTVNLGLTHYSPAQYLLVTKRFALKYHPRAVVWAVAEANDLSDAEDFSSWQRDPRSRQTLIQRFASRSMLAQMLPRVPVTPRARRDFRSTDGAIAEVDLDFTYHPDAIARWPRGWGEIVKTIEEGHRMLESEGVQFLVLFIPIKVRVLGPFIAFRDDEDRNAALPGGLMDAPTDFATAVSHECRQVGCDFIDLTGPLRRRAERDNRHVFFLTLEPHLDVDGNQVVADEVSNWLRSKPGMLPTEVR